MGRMQGKVAFITGGSDGIGRASAIRLAEEGAHVIICARRKENLADAEAAVKAVGSVEALQLDVSDTAAYAKAIEDAHKRHGRLDALVNNAMSVHYSDILNTSLEDWRADFAVNADAVFVGTKTALKLMYPQKSGSIVNIASTNGLLAMIGMSSYSASKAALIHFSAVAALEAAEHNVRVNVIAPGQILTPAVENFAKHDPVRAAKATDAIPMKRGGQPKELADAVLFLVSDESTFVTGACIPVDGGKSVQMNIPT
ncbi:MAG TPA: SDR family oxidoreductase [Alphaproteobacteria bacterium]|nr:SDR family oxidoreductase [Alphaproteobacteria bacterium]